MNPIDVARDVIRRTGQVAVSFSGGKDSLVVLDLAVKELGISNVAAFHLHIIQGLECHEILLRAALARYPGLKLFRLPHANLSKILRNGYLCDVKTGARDRIPLLKPLDVENHVRALTGFEWIASGHRSDDSLQRRAMISAASDEPGFPMSSKLHKCYPIAAWSANDVAGYLRAHKVPITYNAANATGERRLHSDGFGLSPESLARFKKAWPDDFQKVLVVLPYAGAAALEGERRIAARANEVPAVREAASRKKRAQEVPEEPETDQ